MAYRDDIAALGADHHWDFDGDANDVIGSANGTSTSVLYTSSAIAEDATNCMETNAIAGDRVTLPTTTDINNSAQTQKAVCGFFEITEFSPHPVMIYGEGDNVTCFQIICGFGNQCLFEVVEPTNFPTGLQIYGIALVPNRVYHFTAIFLGNSNGNEIKFFIDGVKITNADPADRQPDTADLNSRGVGIFGDPSGTVGVGGGVVLQQAGTNSRYNHWATFDGADADLTDTEIREELFEKGTLANQSISSGTEATMQTSLEAIDNEEKGNHPCCIRIPANTGDTNFTLTANAITFDPLASIHVQYTGTATLTWRNDRNSNATIFSTTAGGTIEVQNETNLKLIGLMNPTEVRVMEVGTQTEIVGEESVTDGEFDQFVYQDSVDIAVFALGYEPIFLKAVDTSADTTIQISQSVDRVEDNPA